MSDFHYTGTVHLETMKVAKNYNAFLASLVFKQPIAAHSELLDIGAGIGVMTEIIRAKGYRITCLEPDAQQAATLMGKGFTTYAKVDDMGSKKFDFMYAFNVLEHIEHDAETLAQWATKLRQNGRLLVYVPAFNVLFSEMDKKVGHYRRYTRKTLTAAICAAGLRPVQRAQYADSVGFLVALLYKLVNRNGKLNRTSLLFFDKFLFPISRFLDLFFRGIFGKNVFIIAEKPCEKK